MSAPGAYSSTFVSASGQMLREGTSPSRVSKAPQGSTVPLPKTLPRWKEVGTYFLYVIRTRRGMPDKLIVPEDKGALVATPHLYTPGARQG